MSENLIFSSLLNAIGLEEQARLSEIRKQWAAYHGEYPTPMKQPLDNIVINYAAICVDALVAALVGENITFELPDEDGEKFVNSVFFRAGAGEFWSGLALMASVTGDVFVKITGGQFPGLVVLDTETVSVSMPADDNRVPVKYVISYPANSKDGPKLIRQTIEKDGEAWKITDEIGDPRSGDWKTLLVTVWPYPFPPIFHAQNLPSPTTYWGKPDIDNNVLALMKQINFTASNISKILRHYAHPKPVGIGFSARDLPNNPDDMIILTNPEARIYNVEMQSDLSSSQTFLDRMTQTLFQAMAVPEIALGKVQGIGTFSGFALRVLYAPMINKVTQKRFTLEKMLRDVILALLTIGGYRLPDSDEIIIRWPTIIPQDEAQARQNALVDKQLGVSLDTLMSNLGYNPEKERIKRVAEEAEIGDRILRQFETGDNPDTEE